MNVLPRDKQIQIISALTEGCSIRAIERITGVHRDTIMRLMVRTGQHCMSLMEDTVKDVPAGTIECDELWTYVKKKDQRYPLEKPGPWEEGSQFIAVAMDRQTKLVLSYRVGKRVNELAYGLISDVQERVVGKPTIITDGWTAYFDATAQIFGRDGCNFAQLVKIVKDQKRKAAREGYAVASVVNCRKYPIFGDVDLKDISTSRIERQNWTLRTHMRRLTRLSNGFSRKLENLKAAVALHYCAYNFCKVHKSLRMTPAMAAKVSASIWDIGTLLPA